MKELSIEKTQTYDGNYKAYKELINRLEDVKNAIAKQNYGIAMDILCKPYPEFQVTTHSELNESEDEKIRKSFSTFFAKFKPNDMWDDDFSFGDIVAWFGKQGEQKPALPKWKYKNDNTPLLRDSIILNKYGCVAKSPSGALVDDIWVLDYDELAKLPKEEIERQDKQKSADKAESKFNAGEWVVVDDGRTGRIIECTKDFADVDLEFSRLSTRVNNIRSWTIQDAREGDVLSFNDGHGNDCIELIKSITDKKIEFWFCLTNGNYCEVFDGITPYTNLVSREDATPATKEQRDTLLKAMADAGYTFDFEKKEVKKIEQKPTNNQFTPEQASILDKHIDKFLEQKPAWNKEDEKIVEALNDYVKNLDIFFSEIKIGDKDIASKEFREKVQAWLKNFKYRVQLQPKQEWSKEDEKIYQSIMDDTVQENQLDDKQTNWLRDIKYRNQWKPSEEQIASLDCIVSYIDNQANWEIGTETIKSLHELKEQLKQL